MPTDAAWLKVLIVKGAARAAVSAKQRLTGVTWKAGGRISAQEPIRDVNVSNGAISPSRDLCTVGWVGRCKFERRSVGAWNVTLQSRDGEVAISQFDVEDRESFDVDGRFAIDIESHSSHFVAEVGILTETALPRVKVKAVRRGQNDAT
jgi:hypothetical protein